MKATQACCDLLECIDSRIARAIIGQERQNENEEVEQGCRPIKS